MLRFKAIIMLIYTSSTEFLNFPSVQVDSEFSNRILHSWLPEYLLVRVCDSCRAKCTIVYYNEMSGTFLALPLEFLGGKKNTGSRSFSKLIFNYLSISTVPFNSISNFVNFEKYFNTYILKYCCMNLPTFAKLYKIKLI